MYVYLAGGWFSPNMLKAVEDIEEVLIDLNIRHFNPRKENLAKADDPSNKLKHIFEGNIKAIDDCDLLIVSTVDKDMGTIFEAGCAFSKGKMIIYYNPFMQNREKFNLMLAQSSIAVCISKEELHDYMKQLIKYEYKGLVE
jgi:nucleoside 2-deoxyribosyltransferase